MGHLCPILYWRGQFDWGWNIQEGLTHAWNVAIACRVGLLYSPHSFFLQQDSLDFFSWWLGSRPAKAEAASLLKDQACKS